MRTRERKRIPSRRSTRSEPQWPHVELAEQYVDDVLSGRILACRWIRLACERHRKDMASSRSRRWPYYFDPAEAERWCRFIELLPHVKGRWASQRGVARPHPMSVGCRTCGSRAMEKCRTASGKERHPHKARMDEAPRGDISGRLRLEPHQCFRTISIFGWRRKKDDTRRFRKVVIMEPRKGGKSTWAAAVGLGMLTLDGEPGAEVYSGATTERQAWEVFGPALRMARKTPALQAAYGIEARAKSIVRTVDDSNFQAIIGNPGDGASPHLAIVDEYHEHKTPDQYNTMITGMGARAQPLLLVISTAGDNVEGPCYDEQMAAQRVLEGQVEDEELFALIYTIDEEDDWTSIEALQKANPNYGVSVSEDFLLSRRKEALASPRKAARYKTKHLNMWVGARTPFFDVRKWQAGARPGLTIEDLRGRRCFVGLDLASKIDLVAVQLVFPPEDGGTEYITLGRYYVPEAQLEDEDRMHYREWAETGELIVTDGNITDIDEVEDDILDLRGMVEVVEVLFDPHQATQLISRLQKEGVPCVENPMTVLTMSEPMKEVDALVRDGRLSHDGNRCMAWQVGNVVARVDAKDNVYPRKEQVERKIDGPVALIMAMGAALRHEEVDHEPEVWTL